VTRLILVDGLESLEYDASLIDFLLLGDLLEEPFEIVSTQYGEFSSLNMLSGQVVRRSRL